VSKIRVLFLCTGNSARSIIGAALLKRTGGDAFDVYSAGTHPKSINPFTAKVLEAINIDISDERSKSVSEFEGQAFDYVITVCDAAAEECPVFPGAPERIHWSFVDPAAVEGTGDEKLRAFQRTVREMQMRLATFVVVATRKALASSESQ
jgi:protein-tyrosine-phosphatase